MSKPGFALLADVIMDPDFPDLDLALRRGRHIDRDDAAWYTLLSDAQEHLELFYKRYGCELIHKADGYYYLLPTGDKLSRKQLSVVDMLVGQALALLYLDPATTSQGGRVTQEELVTQLSSVLGNDGLIGLFNPKRKRLDERIAQKNVRTSVAAAARRLAGLGFVELLEDDATRLRPALMRFAEPVRAAEAPSEALAKLVAKGEVALVQEDEDAASADAYGNETSAGELAAVETSVGGLQAVTLPQNEQLDVEPSAVAARAAESSRGDLLGAETLAGDVLSTEPSQGEWLGAETSAREVPAIGGISEQAAAHASEQKSEAGEPVAAAVPELASGSDSSLHPEPTYEPGPVPELSASEPEPKLESDPRDLSWDDLFPASAATKVAAAEQQDASWGDLFSASRDGISAESVEAEDAVEDDANFDEDDADFTEDYTDSTEEEADPTEDDADPTEDET